LSAVWVAAAWSFVALTIVLAWLTVFCAPETEGFCSIRARAASWAARFAFCCFRNLPVGVVVDGGEDLTGVT
jgi:hypothetical protein